MAKPTNPDAPVTIRYCDSRHKSNVRLNIATLTVLGIIVAGGTTLMSVLMRQQSVIAETASQAVQVTTNAQALNKQTQSYIKEDVETIKKDVGKINVKQDSMNVSLRLLIQKVEDNGKHPVK